MVCSGQLWCLACGGHDSDPPLRLRPHEAFLIYVVGDQWNAPFFLPESSMSSTSQSQEPIAHWDYWGEAHVKFPLLPYPQEDDYGEPV